MFSSNSSQVSSAANYIENVFSSWIYLGNGTTQTITNGIDLSTYGGLVWQKDRTTGGNSHILCDTARGVNAFLRTDMTSAQVNNGGTDAVYAYNTNGFSTGTTNGFSINLAGDSNIAWTFRKQPKFFDVVTWTATGSTQTISHNLGSVPGCIIVKRTSASAAWYVYHQSLGANAAIILNNTNPADTGVPNYWNGTSPTSTQFTVGDYVSATGSTYVAYIFAHNAGGFGLTGSDNVITCGSFTTDGSGAATISLGYEPQWVITKRTDGVSDWQISDTMRGASLTSYGPLNANNANAEDSGTGTFLMAPSATGASFANLGASRTFIYIAIRRGPMAVPTVGTSVFSPVARTGTGANATVTAGFTPDVLWYSGRNAYYNRGPVDKLRGVTKYMYFTSTGAEQTFTTEVTALTNTGMTVGDSSGSTDINKSGIPYINWFLQRAPSFFDEVCYTGTGSATTVTHNLGVVPEMMIVKGRDTITNWSVYTSSTAANEYLFLNRTNAVAIDAQVWNNTRPTSSVFSLGTASLTNIVSGLYVAYLFATCAGVSKVGSYTGNGSTQAIACGFTGGARFVLIKRTDIADWYLYDTARGMTTLTDPYLFTNSTAAETATLGSVTTTTGGFTVNSSILAAINTNGATFVFLAIA